MDRIKPLILNIEEIEWKKFKFHTPTGMTLNENVGKLIKDYNRKNDKKFSKLAKKSVEPCTTQSNSNGSQIKKMEEI